MDDVKGDDKILAQARKRFDMAVSYWSYIYDLAREDIKFANGNSDNGYQWDARILRDRQSMGATRPSLTINKLPQHIAQVTNDQRRNKPQIKVRPVDDEGDDEVAEVLNGMIRHIHRNANDCYEGADVAFTLATEHQVEGGIGYFKVATDYCRDDGDEQDLYIGAVPDFTAIMDDPSIKTVTGRDRRYLFESVMLDEEEFEATWPDADAVDWSAIGPDRMQWYDQSAKRVRVAQYWTCTDVKVKGRKRPQRKVTCYTLAGHQILDSKEWAGKYIPYCRVVGRMRMIDGKPEIAGIVRNAKDAQRLYNYGRSSQAENLGLTTKAPYMAPAQAVAGYEDQWETANTVAHSVLYYNAYDSDQRQLPPPQRVQPAMPSPAVSEMVGLASDDIKATTGQYDASLGQRSNETSGIAIRQRQAEGDMATFHFVDNLSYAIKFCGDILVDMIPRVYDTPRIARILGEDEVADYAELDPTLESPMEEHQDPATGKRKKKYNLARGTYDVAVTVGPGYSTQRQEALEFLQAAGQSAPQILAATADMLPKLADMPMADEMAKRLRAMLPPPVQQVVNASANGQTELPPEAMAMMDQAKQQLGQAHGQLEALQQALQQLQAQNAELQSGADLKREEIQSRERIAQMNNEVKLQVEQVKGEVKAQLELMQARMEMAQQAQAQSMQPGPQLVIGANGEAKNVSDVAQAVQDTHAAMQQIAQMVAQLQDAHGQLAGVVAESSRPRSKTIEMRSPSGQVYRAVVDGGNITMESPMGGQYAATVQ